VRDGAGTWVERRAGEEEVEKRAAHRVWGGVALFLLSARTPFFFLHTSPHLRGSRRCFFFFFFFMPRGVRCF
jgi:hypothetical protein